MDYLPSIRHGQFTAGPERERRHDLECPCMSETEQDRLAQIRQAIVRLDGEPRHRYVLRGNILVERQDVLDIIDTYMKEN